MRSLLDRLFDDERGKAIEEGDDEASAEAEDGARHRQKDDDDFDAVLSALERDLNALLNTCRPYPSWRNGVEDSVVGYGLADLTAEDFSSTSARDRIAAAIAQCIRRFEPRLSAVEVEADPAASPSAGLKFRIRGELLGVAIPVEYSARIRPIDRMIQIGSGR
ncbi:MAG TPA: type VI secretion system baseplate subunit TssE [Allosphingosinicella sp.]|jgi:type VI secretion system lysozyme-like protein